MCCTENHLSIECRESSATSVLLEVDFFDSFLSLMKFLYFHVVSGNTFFFLFVCFIYLGAKVSVPGGRETACRPTDLKENCGMELCLNFFFKYFYFFL